MKERRNFHSTEKKWETDEISKRGTETKRILYGSLTKETVTTSSITKNSNTKLYKVIKTFRTSNREVYNENGEKREQ